jgi:hypothetical protein
MSRPKAVSPFENWGKKPEQHWRPASTRFGY